ncbi:hypothetical protein PO124_08470 [Bacillus licheniformis]|nr:hypothetical protein [Bacillus licheniformis]
MNVETSLQRLSSLCFDHFIFFAGLPLVAAALSLYYLCSFRHKPPEDKWPFSLQFPCWAKPSNYSTAIFIAPAEQSLQAGLSVYDSLKAFESQPFYDFIK